MSESRTVRYLVTGHSHRPVPEWKGVPMPEPVRYQNEETQSGTGMLQPPVPDWNDECRNAVTCSNGLGWWFPVTLGIEKDKGCRFKTSRNQFPAWRNPCLGIGSWAWICKSFKEPRNRFPACLYRFLEIDSRSSETFTNMGSELLERVYKFGLWAPQPYPSQREALLTHHFFECILL